MSPNDIISFFETLVDDAPDTAAEFILMDNAYTKRNEARIWTFLLALDTSITHGSSDVWTTTHALPVDFDEPYKVFGGASDNEYDPVPYEDVLRWISSQNKYTIDYINNTMRFTGAASSALTVYLWYKKSATSLIGMSDAQKASASTIVWPKRFCPILAFDMAAIHQGGIEADEITRQQVPYLNKQHKELADAMVNWDNRRRMKMFANSASPRRHEPGDRPDVINW